MLQLLLLLQQLLLLLPAESSSLTFPGAIPEVSPEEERGWGGGVCPNCSVTIPSIPFLRVIGTEFDVAAPQSVHYFR